jgi:hypothetical protein
MTINCFDAYTEDNADSGGKPGGSGLSRLQGSANHHLIWSTRFFGLPGGSKYPLGLAHVCQFDDAGITCTCYLEHYNVPFVRGIPRLIAVLA